jgi:hypothetical protein
MPGTRSCRARRTHTERGEVERWCGVHACLEGRCYALRRDVLQGRQHVLQARQLRALASTGKAHETQSRRRLHRQKVSVLCHGRGKQGGDEQVARATMAVTVCSGGACTWGTASSRQRPHLHEWGPETA